MSEVVDLQAMDEGQVRQMLASMLTQISARDATIRFKQALIDKLTHENAVLKRLKFGLKSEKMNAEQRSLLDETLDADLAAVSDEIALAVPESAAAKDKQTPKRQALPAELPRQTFAHEPDSTVCTAPGCGAQMKRIGEDVSEKLDYVPGVFSVHRHVRGKWACVCCQTLVQAPVEPHVIDKGIPTAAGADLVRVAGAQSAKGARRLGHGQSH